MLEAILLAQIFVAKLSNEEELLLIKHNSPSYAILAQLQPDDLDGDDKFDDDCNGIKPPPWCIYQVRPDGQLEDSSGTIIKDWSDTIEKFEKEHPTSKGPIIRDDSGRQFKLESLD